MTTTRNSEHKPLSFSTTMRNPSRIVTFLQALLPFEGQILTDDIIERVMMRLIHDKLYTPTYITKTKILKAIHDSENSFSEEQLKEILINSPQKHKEAGFAKGWPSRFDTMYKLSMEFGFLFYEMGSPIVISTTGHMLVDAQSEDPINNQKIQDIFLNAMTKYQTNNPFRKNLNSNVPLVLSLQVINLLKNDLEENDAGLFRSELSLIICWPDADAVALYSKIKELRRMHGYSYGDEIIYDICLDILKAPENKKNRFKISQITGEAIDEFIRKMRITGIFTLRGAGRFLDINTFEIDKVNYILDNYSDFVSYATPREFFDYMGVIDPQLLTAEKSESKDVEDIKISTLKKWANDYSKEEIRKELLITCKKTESKNQVLRIIDRPTRLEFLTSIALVQQFSTLKVVPNYSVDDEGLPKFTAAGGKVDIECFDPDCNPLIEVTLMTSRGQSTHEIPAITRHLDDATKQNPNTLIFTIFIAPSIHPDTEYMVGYTKTRFNLDILAYTVEEFLNTISNKDNIKILIKDYIHQ